MRALSDALPTGHRAMTNPTLQLHFGCGRATPPVSHSHNWPSRRMQNFLFKIGQKSYFFANKDPQTNFDDWMILQKHVLSFQCNTFFKMANLKAISSSATLNDFGIPQTEHPYNYIGDRYLSKRLEDNFAETFLDVLSARRSKLGIFSAFFVPVCYQVFDVHIMCYIEPEILNSIAKYP